MEGFVARMARHGVSKQDDLDVGAGLLAVDLQEQIADAQGRALVVGDDDLDLFHVGHYRGDDQRRHGVYPPNRLTGPATRRKLLTMLGTPNRDRKAERRSATRREIIDAAWRIAREKGLAQVTLREVAGLVGMRAPSLYTHFASKNAIYDAMFGDAWTQFLEYIEAAESGAPKDSRAAMRYYARVYFDFAVAFPARHELMSLRTIPDFTPTAEGYAPSVAVMEGFVARMARHGVSKQDDLDIFVAIVSGMVDTQLANDPGGDRWSRLLDRAIDMFADSIAATTERSRP
jgi:AcrR family transcriptional regulator